MNSTLSKALVAELIGTFALIFVGAGAGIMTGLGIGNLVSVALAHGLVIVVFAYAYGHISGTHINPAVTFGLWVAGRIETVKMLFYWVAQLLGAIVAGFLLLWVFRSLEFSGDAQAAYTAAQQSSALVYGATALSNGVTPFVGLLLEIIATFFLVNTVMNAAVSGKAGQMAGFAIGMTLTFMIFFIGPLTGASLNPARTLGPAVAMGGAYPWGDIWLYIVGPLVGGALAGALYRFFLAPPAEPVPAAVQPSPAQAAQGARAGTSSKRR
jgi:MIP family channel proteins